jgi:hypothetical protein
MKKLILILCLLNLNGCSPGLVQPKNPDGSAITQDLRIGSFNIQIFGDTKYGNLEVRNSLISILSRYDIVLIQEIRDADSSSIYALKSDLDTKGNFGMVLGSRVGRSSSKEQYAFIYRQDKVNVLSSYEYQDSNDVFEREPLVVLFQSKTSQNPFFLIGLHSKPDDAFNEIEHLYEVFMSAQQIFNMETGMALGDLNSDCSYLSDAQFQDLQFYKDSRFRFLFSKYDDSTVGSSDCQYDQIIINSSLTDNLYSGTESRYDFLSALGLSQSQGESVSDHYPIEALFSF